MAASMATFGLRRPPSVLVTSELGTLRGADTGTRSSSPRQLELCRVGYRTLPELAALLRRDPESLRNHYVVPMLERGLLVRRHPDRPHHPQQAYRTAAKSGKGQPP